MLAEVEPACESESGVTIDEYLKLPERTDGHDELLRGRVLAYPFATATHGYVHANVMYYLHGPDEGWPNGLAIGRCGYILSRNPDSLLVPDASFICGPTAAILSNDYPEIAPDLAVEVLSPWDVPAVFAEKLDVYSAAGVRQIWVLDPETETVTIHTERATAVVLSATDILYGGPVLPEFTVKVSDFFD